MCTEHKRKLYYCDSGEWRRSYHSSYVSIKKLTGVSLDWRGGYENTVKIVVQEWRKEVAMWILTWYAWRVKPTHASSEVVRRHLDVNYLSVFKKNEKVRIEWDMELAIENKKERGHPPPSTQVYTHTRHTAHLHVKGRTPGAQPWELG